ncbi:AP-1 complex subunit mu [Aduncisulcus paluster]|uniref:AP-1 complex subunit mu n=1 Tax=Aduncisulcus paluster TaxID=2918883 RepID=A0ABQ5K3D1_9EUKA|nr:AP-1 complex subunit mu [Aduncisulcus paluster]|eukprot:gnl/Carplike_NY0171/2957_a3979_369.p1 GENE.gnl/Carplike_NY0171/2957_a3979_369~~gnl/Carplike_NY0171/2957_a3979_369.p1  ORF type:complete len:448 (-),score=84.55 gnl/Carplike_NY0171/2957_a3979_369:96-1439(-)
MSASAIYILDYKGRTLIHRDFRGDVPSACRLVFIRRVLEEEDELLVKPIFHEMGITYVYIKISGLYFLIVTRDGENASLLVSFLYNFSKVLKSYFGFISEESINDNFVIIYELIDETLDMGLPQITEASVLKEYIMHDAVSVEQKVAPVAVTGAVSWRPEGIRYGKNVCHVDVIEKVDMSISADGSIISSDVRGQIMMNTALTGMPELKLGLNDRVRFINLSSSDAESHSSVGTRKSGKGSDRTVDLEDVSFHQCVRESSLRSSGKSISFIPPDKEFQLMTYRYATPLPKAIVSVNAHTNKISSTREEVAVQLRTLFKSRSVAQVVVVSIPVPLDTFSPTMHPSVGSCMYVPDKSIIRWTLKQIEGGSDATCRIEYSLPSVREEEEIGTIGEGTSIRKPIEVSFIIPYFTVSGLQIRFLKIVEKSGYETQSYLRYTSRSGSYIVKHH